MAGNINCFAHHIERQVIVADDAQARSIGHRCSAGDLACRGQFYCDKWAWVLERKVFDVPIIFGTNCPDREALVVTLSVVLLNCGTSVVNATSIVKKLALVNVAKHRKVKLFKDGEVVFSVLHRPTSVSLAVRDGAVIEGDVNLVWIGGLNPIVSVKHR